MSRRSWIGAAALLAVRDIRVFAGWLWVVLPFYLGYGAAVFVSTHAFVFVNGLFVFVLSAAPLLLELRHNTDLLFCSLPVDRSAVVAGRYAGSLLIVAVGMAACLGYGALLGAVIPSRAGHFSVAAAAGKLVPVGAGTLVLLCVFYPFVFRWGLGKAVYRFVFCLLGAAGLALAAGGLVWFCRHGSLTEYGSRAVATALARAVTDGSLMWRRLGRGGAAVVSVLAAAGVAAASCLLSIRFYRRRDF